MLFRLKPEMYIVRGETLESAPKYGRSFSCHWMRSWYWSWTKIFNYNDNFCYCWGSKTMSQYTWYGIRHDKSKV